MKILAAIALFLSIVFGPSVLALSPKMEAELDLIEAHLRASPKNFKLDEEFSSTTALNVMEWPEKAQNSLNSTLQQKTEIWSSADGRWVINYDFSTSLIRSIEVHVAGEKVYIAIYNSWQYISSRSKNFLEYYVMDSSGKFIRVGTLLNP